MVMTALVAGSVSLFALTGAMPPPQSAPGTAVPEMKAKAAKIGEAAPAFSLKDANGKEVSLADYKGKVVVLEWINVDCPIDQRVVSSKLISTVYDKFKDKVAWLAIDSTSTHTKADYDKTITSWNISYPLLNDAKGTVGHLYNAKTTPHMYIIDKDGTLVYAGGIDDDANGTKATRVNYVDKALTELFAGKPIEIKESAPYGCSVKYAN